MSTRAIAYDRPSAYLLNLYHNQYVAHDANHLIAHCENLHEVLDLAKASWKASFYKKNKRANLLAGLLNPSIDFYFLTEELTHLLHK